MDGAKEIKELARMCSSASEHQHEREHNAVATIPALALRSKLNDEGLVYKIKKLATSIPSSDNILLNRLIRRV